MWKVWGFFPNLTHRVGCQISVRCIFWLLPKIVLCDVIFLTILYLWLMSRWQRRRLQTFDKGEKLFQAKFSCIKVKIFLQVLPYMQWHQHGTCGAFTSVFRFIWSKPMAEITIHCCIFSAFSVPFHTTLFSLVRTSWYVFVNEPKSSNTSHTSLFLSNMI